MKGVDLNTAAPWDWYLRQSVSRVRVCSRKGQMNNCEPSGCRGCILVMVLWTVGEQGKGLQWKGGVREEREDLNTVAPWG